MSIVPVVGRKKTTVRIFLAVVYLCLTLAGAAMVVPFLVMLASSNANDYDYSRFSPIPRSAWSAEDRFLKGLALYYNRFRGWESQFRAAYPDAPSDWTTWRAIGRDPARADAFARAHRLPPDGDWTARERRAADYADFVTRGSVTELVAAMADSQSAQFLKRRYAEQSAAAGGGRGVNDALALLNRAWDTGFDNFLVITFKHDEMLAPVWQRTHVFPTGPKYIDFLAIKEAARRHAFTPGALSAWRSFAAGRPGVDSGWADADAAPNDATREAWAAFLREKAPAPLAIPFMMRAVWYDFLESDSAAEQLGLVPGERFDVTRYNNLAGTVHTNLRHTPFPLPPDFDGPLRSLWEHFLKERYPLRLVTLDSASATPEAWQTFLSERFGTLEYANRLLGTTAAAWTDFSPPLSLPTDPAEESLRLVWLDFAAALPISAYQPTSAEQIYQDLLRERYGDIAAVNAAHHTAHTRMEEAFPDFDAAYAVTFRNLSGSFLWNAAVHNFGTVASFLWENANAIPVTAALVFLSILLALTVNPLAAYALSRFNLPGGEKIILFLLATMAFPAMVSAIPAYLLMRDLGLLNTLAALVLPGAANGMAIFILRGFFDSLPPELYEAATIDGASEWQIFRIVTLPLLKPILAINALSAFIAAYNSWEWALVICQEKSRWTIAVWLYQANQWWTEEPWLASAGFVLASIPTLLVFIFCQKIILRGIVIPTMK